ncbi:MAG TPA: GMC oxidoreductase [Nakamurella sp.]
MTLRLIGESEQVAGRYADSTWVFDIPPTERDFELILDGQVVSKKAKVVPPAAAIDLDEGKVAFGSAPIPIDDGRLQQLWFKQGVVDQDRWDVIVVGTGIGGGSVIAELSRQQYRDKSWRKFTVLGLEAGSLLFTGHVANQPRVLFGQSGRGATALWNSLSELGSRPYSLSNALKAKDAWGGYQVFALGGRSLFWGGLCPRMDRADLTAWPDNVVAELRGPNRFGPAYYDRAEETLGVHKSRRTGLERDCLRLLNRLYPGRVNDPAPVAIPRPKRSDWTIPDGMFSTAELLLAQRLGRADGEDSYGPPYIDLAQLVVAIEPDADGWVVHGVDLRDGSPTCRRARKVVLGAGTIETPRIMKTSALRQGPESIGHFLTEHLMAHMWFEIPRNSPYYRSARAANLLSRPGCQYEPFDLGRCNVQLQVNSDLIFDQPRMPGVPPNQTVTKDGAVAAQLVFMAGRDLDPDGQVKFYNNKSWLPGLGGNRKPPAARLNLNRINALPDGWEATGRRVIGELGGECLPNLADDLTVSASGAVSHEVGTMRMGASRDCAVVDENLQVFGQRGLYVCDNSVFASSPAANPSLTLAALGIRLADHLWSAK